ncbi:MAG: complex I subunit 1 family protein [archaeon]
MDIFGLLIFPGLAFLLTLALFYEWLDRRFVARLQNRCGPVYAGSHGLLQPLADLIKLLAKEDLEPLAVDKPLFRSVPILLPTLPLTLLFLIPIGGVKAFVHFEGDLIFTLFIIHLVAILAFLGGWSSTNTFSAMGGMRSAMQMLGSEIPLAIALVGPAITARSLSITNIVEWQVVHGLWMVGLAPVGFGIAVFTMLAGLERVPFDSPKAETEIVAGWQTEFSGRKLALMRLASDLEVVLVAGLITSIFLGGPSGPVSLIPGVIWFLIKSTLIVLLLSTLRSLFARFRIDQMLCGCWKYLVPLAILQVVLLQAILR